MIYEWITGQLPFVPQDPQANLYMAYNYMHKVETAPSLSTAGIIVPDVMEQVIAIALSKDPEQTVLLNRSICHRFTDAANHKQ